MLLLSVLCIVCLGNEARVIRAEWSKKLFPLLAAGALLYAVAVLTMVLGDMLTGHSAKWPLKIHNFSNRRFLNQWQSWLLPLLPILLYAHVPKCRRLYSGVLFFVVFALLWAMLAYSLGRAAVYAQLGLVFIMPLLFGRRAFFWLSVQVAAAMLGVLFCVTLLGFNFFDPAIEAPVGRLASFEDQPRLQLLMLSALFIKESPLLGIGPMQFASVQNFIAAHPHNALFQLAAEWGLPATLAFGVLVAWPFLHWLRFACQKVRSEAVGHEESWLIMSLTASMLAAGAHSMVSGIIVMPMSLIMMVIVVGLAFAVYRAHNPRQFLYSKVVLVPAGLISVGLSLYLGVFTLVEASRLARYDEVGHPLLVTHLQPRYWQQGNLFHLMADDPRVFPRSQATVMPEELLKDPFE